jgi:hypothetical protein
MAFCGGRHLVVEELERVGHVGEDLLVADRGPVHRARAHAPEKQEDTRYTKLHHHLETEWGTMMMIMMMMMMMMMITSRETHASSSVSSQSVGQVM